MSRPKKCDARLYWVKFNLDDCRAAISDLETFEEKGRFFSGFIVGAGGFEMKDSWCLIQKRGYIIGKQFLDEATEFGAKQSGRVKSRYSNTGSTETLPKLHRNASETHTEMLPTNNQQPTSNSSSATPPQKAAKKKSPKVTEGPSLPEILGDEAENYWNLTKVWSGNKMQHKAQAECYLKARKEFSAEHILGALQQEAQARGKFQGRLLDWFQNEAYRAYQNEPEAVWVPMEIE